MVMNKQVLIFLGILFVVVPMVSAGIGISWAQESALINENEKTCLTYKIFNPFEGDVYAEVVLSEGLEDIVTYQESETKLIPAQTSRLEAMPVTFCFKTPKVYPEDCLIGGDNGVICKQECTEDMKVFKGEVEIAQADSSEFEGSGSGGSKTALSVSAPLRVKVKCVEHGRNYSLVYLVVAIIAAVLLTINLLKSRKDKKSGNSVKGKKKSSKKKN